MKKLFLLRYDTEATSPEELNGFFEKVVSVHRSNQIPATFFCRGAAIENRESDFLNFFREVKDDTLFDIQDHSYSHIGLGYQNGKSLELLKDDYEKSFAIHERVFGKFPIGISICGTGGVDGPRLLGFNETEKARAELNMVAQLGVKMINSFLVEIDESREFVNYASIGHPEIMGFPSGYSDTSWMYRKEFGNPLDYILSQIKERGDRGEHIPLMLHDWVAWNHAPDKGLTHVKKIAEYARKHGYELITHVECYQAKCLWQQQ